MEIIPYVLGIAHAILEIIQHVSDFLKSQIYILTFIFFILQCFDWYSTVTIINRGGHEENPVMSFVFKYVKPTIAMGIKAVALIFVGYAIGCVYPLLLLLLIFVYVNVAKHNWKSL